MIVLFKSGTPPLATILSLIADPPTTSLQWHGRTMANGSFQERPTEQHKSGKLSKRTPHY